MKLIVTFDDITFFDAWPAYKINEMIFCSKFILGCLCLRMIAAHTPTTAFVFGLATLVFVQACRNESRVGAFWTAQNEVDPKTAQLSASLWTDFEEKIWCCQNTSYESLSAFLNQEWL